MSITAADKKVIVELSKFTLLTPTGSITSTKFFFLVIPNEFPKCRACCHSNLLLRYVILLKTVEWFLVVSWHFVTFLIRVLLFQKLNFISKQFFAFMNLELFFTISRVNFPLTAIFLLICYTFAGHTQFSWLFFLTTPPKYFIINKEIIRRIKSARTNKTRIIPSRSAKYLD